MKYLNIPIYRAKRFDSDRYVTGFYYYDKNLDTHHIKYVLDSREGFKFGRTMHPRIDPSTLAIHFPYMLDSENNPIFASLSEDGKGGDIFEGSENDKVISVYKDGLSKFYTTEKNTIFKFDNADIEYFKKTGIQE